MGIMVYSLLWVMQDFVHQPYIVKSPPQKQKMLQGVAQSTPLEVERRRRHWQAWVDFVCT